MKMKSEELKKICSILFESGALKLVPRSGWLKVGVENPESVAEHSFRTALVAFFLSIMEGFNFSKACEIAFLALIHDLHETRTLDLHKLARRYIKLNAEDVFEEQLKNFPEEVRESILKLKENRDIVEIVEDADKIELYLQAKEYSEKYPSAKYYMENIELKKKQSRKLLEELKSTDHRWWLKFE